MTDLNKAFDVLTVEISDNTTREDTIEAEPEAHSTVEVEVPEEIELNKEPQVAIEDRDPYMDKSSDEPNLARNYQEWSSPYLGYNNPALRMRGGQLRSGINIPMFLLLCMILVVVFIIFCNSCKE